MKDIPTESLLGPLPEAALILDTRTDRILAWNRAAASLLGGRPDAAPPVFSTFCLRS